MNTFVTRFAPSPSGHLHLGHAFSALYAFNAAQEAGGRFILRIEDIDTTRCKPAFERAIIDDLHWLGLRWERPVRRQTEHLVDYATTLGRLQQMGVLYRCFLTRREIINDMVRAPHGTGDVYMGPDTPMSEHDEATRLDKGDGFAWRLSLRAAREVLGHQWHDLDFHEQIASPNGTPALIQAQPELLGDVILARKDIATSYHLAVTHDDDAQGITHIIRGNDLFEITHIHVLLQALLGLPTPVYHHHHLITDEAGKRLAKRDRATTLQSLRESGVNARAVRERLIMSL